MANSPFAGDKRSRSRNASARELLHERYGGEARREWRIGKEGVGPSFRFALNLSRPSLRAKRSNPERHLSTGLLRRFAPRNDEARKGSGTPTDAHSNLPCCWHGRASSRRRTSIGVPPRLCPREYSIPRCNLRPVSWDLAERRSVTIPLPGAASDAVCAGVTRPRPVPVQRAPRGPVRSAGRLMPKAARERFATPRAGAALAPCAGVPPAQVLYERESRTDMYLKQ